MGESSPAREVAEASARQRGPRDFGRRAFLMAAGLLGLPGCLRRARAEPAPSVGSWRAWNHPRLSPVSFSVTTLVDGRVVLIGGGIDPWPTKRPLEHAAEILDPKSGIWSLTDPLPTHAVEPITTALLDGRLLLAGGFDHRTQEASKLKMFSRSYEAPKVSRAMLDASWTFDPQRGWQPSGRLNERRAYARGCRLGDGRVLVAGGAQIFFGSDYVTPRLLTQVKIGILASTEIWSPATGNWTLLRPMLLPRFAHSLNALPDGRVLAVGGKHSESEVDGPSAGTAEVWEPTSRIWRAVAPPRWERVSHTATLLRDGRVLVAGGSRPTEVGHSGADTRLRAVEIWDPATYRWDDAAPLNEARSDHDAVLLADGRVLVADAASARAEIWDPSSDRWTPLPPFSTPPAGRVCLAPLPGGRVLLVCATSTQLWSP